MPTQKRSRRVNGHNRGEGAPLPPRRSARDPSMAAAVRAVEQYLATPEPPPPTVTPTPPRKPMVVEVPKDVSEELASAKVITRGLFPNAVVIDFYTTRLMGATDYTACVEALKQTIATVQQGDLGPADALLVAQATSLNAIYVQCASIASFNLERPDVMERYLRLALRAQGQSRATIEALALLRNPTAVFAKQANIAQGPQQVNNVASVTTAPEEPSRARAEKLGQNELLPPA